MTNRRSIGYVRYSPLYNFNFIEKLGRSLLRLLSGVFFFKTNILIWTYFSLQPRIDPLKLLTCLKVLLAPNGGIRSANEVKRLAE